MLPAASVARTLNVCDPFARPEYAFGEVQALQAPASSWHSNDEPVSDEVNVKLADAVVTVPLGPPVIVVSGGVVSGAATLTVHVRVAGEASVLPAASVARTLNVCEPFASPSRPSARCRRPTRRRRAGTRTSSPSRTR